MSFTDILIPILVFLLVLNSFFPIKKTGWKRKQIIELIIGFITVIFSLLSSYQNDNKTENLNGKIDKLLEQREIDSSNNTAFQKYLKDTFGIVMQNNKPVIYNTKIYNLKAKQSNAEGLPDSLNYSFKMKGDTLCLAPKEGTWAHGYFAFDTSNGTRFESMLFDGMGTANSIDKIVVGNKILNTHLFKIYDKPVYRGEPITLKMTGDLNRYVIFGDQGIPSKRYFYKQGRVTWIPEK